MYLSDDFQTISRTEHSRSGKFVSDLGIGAAVVTRKTSESVISVNAKNVIFVCIQGTKNPSKRRKKCDISPILTEGYEKLP